MTTKAAIAAKKARDLLASSVHFFDFSNISDEWKRYQRWRSTAVKPQNLRYYTEYYLEHLVAQANSVRNSLVSYITDHSSDQPLVDAITNYVDEISRLLKIYSYGVSTTDGDPQDEAAFWRAIQPLSTAAQDKTIAASLTDLPANVALKSTIVPAPPAPDSLLEKLFPSQIKFVGADAAYQSAVARGFKLKFFRPLHKSVPSAALAPDDKAVLANLNSTTPYDVDQELGADPRPSQIDFRAFGYSRHPEDYSDKYFIDLHRVLYDRVVDWAEKWFGDIDLPDAPAYAGSPWQEEFGNQFIEYTRLVAHEDRHVGGWEALLRKRKFRKWLIVGIVGQIIQKKIFSELLFGVDRWWKHELESEDIRLVNVEGYRRKASRSEKVKMALGGMFVPSNFWGDVDDLAWRSALVFEPLINLLDIYRPLSGEHQTSLSHLHQELHMIMSIAGFLQVCTALSPSVFHHLSATPGARMDYNIEHQAQVALYAESKDANETLEAQWEEAQDRLNAGTRLADDDVARFCQMYPIPLKPGVTVANCETATTDADYSKKTKEALRHRLRGARVQIAVFPMLKRYTPLNRGVRPQPINADPDDNDNDNDNATTSTTTTTTTTNDNQSPTKKKKGGNVLDWADLEGQRVTDVSRCTVIYYQGLMYPRHPADDGVALDTHLSFLKGYERLPPRLSTAALVVASLAAILAIVFVLWVWRSAVWGRAEADAWAAANGRPIADFFRNAYASVADSALACRLLCALAGRCACLERLLPVPVPVPAPAPVPA
ncbi:hypothetical protein SLS62_001076 [Diatrype stigma]|uniref:Uncharacterized protein n=1 Tax=Diatrype stigma TaxID=117547 RepID=A0AAN9VBH4_9PEZI